jgi:hypothetical protein
LKIISFRESLFVNPQGHSLMADVP